MSRISPRESEPAQLEEANPRAAAKAAARLALCAWKRAHGVWAHFAGEHRQPGAWSAYYFRPKADPQKRSFYRLLDDYSMAALERRGLIQHGDSEWDACRRLAVRNSALDGAFPSFDPAA